MKKIFLAPVMAMFLLVFSCDDDSSAEPIIATENKVLLLKVDMQTNTFEGGKELIFDEYDSFTIDVDYNSPGDFGDITLKYQEANANIFAGTIVWAGSGEMTYPQALNAPASLTTLTTEVDMPNIDDIELVPYGTSALSHYPDLINYDAIWNAIDDLQLVNQYRAANPNAKVNLFLYTPSVGAGIPAEWDWYVILKN